MQTFFGNEDLSKKPLDQIEAEIDAAFASNPLAAKPYSLSMWTLLSAAEEYYFKALVIDDLDEWELEIFVDGLLNGLTHPLRVCHAISPRQPTQFSRDLDDENYSAASKWIGSADDYDNFCTIFPLYRNGAIELHVDGNTITPSSWGEDELRYEVYDRFISRRDQNSIPEVPEDKRKEIADAVNSALKLSPGRFNVVFSRRLVSTLCAILDGNLRARHLLPENWAFNAFSIVEFRQVLICLQALACGWLNGRLLAAQAGVTAYGYSSAVWTPRKNLLINLIARQSGVPAKKIAEILQYLTFGEKGIRNPDIAIQPIVALSEETLAVSPFVLLNVNGERNLCVLLNQIPQDKAIYSQVVEEKEAHIRRQTKTELEKFGWDFRTGSIGPTDIDLAIIDRTEKLCLCVEIKWFIEPAEVREVFDRMIELQKGVRQCKSILKAFSGKSDRFFDLLGVDASYKILAVVGSQNFIGRARIQDDRVPIVKVWHLTDKLRSTGCLKETMTWLENRDFLPKDTDFRIREIELECGNWNSRWYGILPNE